VEFCLYRCAHRTVCSYKKTAEFCFSSFCSLLQIFQVMLRQRGSEICVAYWFACRLQRQRLKFLSVVAYGFRRLSNRMDQARRRHWFRSKHKKRLLRNKKFFMSKLGCFLDNFWPLHPNLASCSSCCQYFSRYLQYYIYFSLNI